MLPPGLPPRVPGISLGSLEVPTGSFSLGTRMYLCFTTDSTDERAMVRSVPARTDDEGRSFHYLCFIHANWDTARCGSAFDPGRAHEGGGEYGPYLVSPWTTGGEGTPRSPSSSPPGTPPPSC